MGIPGLLEQLGLKTMNPAIVLQFHKAVFKSAPCLTLETLTTHSRAGTNVNYKTWPWFPLISPPFSVCRGYFTSMEAEAHILLAPAHVAVCSCNQEGRVMLLSLLVTTGSQRTDLAVGRYNINFFFR